MLCRPPVPRVLLRSSPNCGVGNCADLRVATGGVRGCPACDSVARTTQRGLPVRATVRLPLLQPRPQR